ncbi:cobalamin-binding protein [Nitrospira sp. NS4]|uniref:cobalamin-binding protein n=1 Tax=Nitrospira sp. NS4 TaxID=3414498 RepID=UPI003C2D139B
MKICSLVPGATEIIAELGLADQLVAISHECDYPASVRHAPVVVEPVVGSGSSTSRDIDRAVKELVASGQRVYRLNIPRFLEAEPEVILTQDLCHVCAVTPDQLTQAIESLPATPQVVTLNPASLSDILQDIERIARAVGAEARGQVLVQSLRAGLAQVRSRATAARPRVVCLEWLDPLYIAGHWVPEMVALAGGEDVLGNPDQPSRETTWEEVGEANPDLLLVMPCGYPVQRTLDELARVERTGGPWSTALAQWPATYVVDAAAYFSRPGPRLLDGVELLADIFHPSPSRPLDPEKAVLLSPSLFALEPQHDAR